MKLRLIATVLTALALSACGDQPEPKTPQAPQGSGAAPMRTADPARIERGGRLYQAHCAACHGTAAQGATDWRRRGPDGRFPPPPLNGTGHAWHHPMAALREVINNGSPGGQGNMPAWKGKLSPGQVDDIIAWFQSRWPNEVWAAWQAIDRRARR